MSYPYKENGDKRRDPKSYRDEEGHVKTAPSNFYTSPMKKGQICGKNVMFGDPEFRYKDGDKYDVAKELARKEREYHLSKI